VSGHADDSSKCLGADQPLRQQHGDGVAGLEHHGNGGADHGSHFVGTLDTHADDAHRLEHRLDRLAHGKLPRIALAEIADEFGISREDALWAVRMALFGESEGPPLELLLPLLGHDCIMLRVGAMGNTPA